MAIPEARVDLSGRTQVARAPSLPSIDTTTTPGTTRVQLWDWPLRLFHWSLLAAVATAIVTGELGGDWMAWHGCAGITVVGLLAFRVVWGLIGSSTARFSHFAPTPGKILAYLRGRWRGTGHNPLGALSVFGLLGVLAFQAGSGLFSNDDIAFTGPLAGLIGDGLSHTLTNWHRQVANGLFVLIGLHVAAIAFYALVKKDKLVRPMVTGWKDIPADLPKPRRARRVALIAAFLAGAAASYAASGAWIAQPAAPEAATPVGTSANAVSATQAGTGAAKPATSNAPAW
ncbi:MAG: cytochrome b/b6 domain-containing protein [Chryseolinea sp.]